MKELRHYTEAFSHLHTATKKGFRAPHKAVLLLAVIDLVEEGAITSPNIELSDRLIRQFDKLWLHFLRNSAIFIPNITQPFFHMQYESFWRLVEHAESHMAMVAEPLPYVEGRKRKMDLPQGGYSVKAMRRAFAYAEMDNQLFLLLQNADARAMLRVVLINGYLTNQPTRTMPDLSSLILAIPFIAFVA